MRHLGVQAQLVQQSTRGQQDEEDSKERWSVNTGVLCRVKVGRACSGGASSCLEALYMGNAGVDERDMSMDDRQHGAVVRWDERQRRSRTRGRHLN
jgi:hypothetical protein